MAVRILPLRRVAAYTGRRLAPHPFPWWALYDVPEEVAFNSAAVSRWMRYHVRCLSFPLAASRFQSVLLSAVLEGVALTELVALSDSAAAGSLWPNRLGLAESAALGYAAPAATTAMKVMTAMKASRGMTASGMYGASSTATGFKKKDLKGVFASLGEIVTAELKKDGRCVVPGIARLKLQRRPARKATTRMMFGEMKKVAAKPALKVIKAFPVKALKDAVSR